MLAPGSLAADRALELCRRRRQAENKRGAPKAAPDCR
jgi:hypothetical protein